MNESEVRRLFFRVAAAFHGNQANAQSGVAFVDVDPFPLPPDPGEAGKQTLQGIDADKDGVRDDIQRFIAINYYGSPKTVAALRQSANNLQSIITTPSSDAGRLGTLRSEMFRANDCLEYVAGALDAAAMFRGLLAEVLNTGARSAAYTTAQSAIGIGGYFLTPEDQLKDGCQFDPNN